MKKLIYFISIHIWALALFSSCNMGVGSMKFDSEEEAKAAGKSDVWAHAYALQTENYGRTKKFAEKYANIYTEQLKNDKSPAWADSYASEILWGKSKKIAKSSANKFEKAYYEARNKGKSHTWADSYASRIVEGKSKKAAREYSDKKKSKTWLEAYELKIKYYGGSKRSAAKYANIYEEQLNKGKSPAWAGSFATQTLLGKNSQSASKISSKFEIVYITGRLINQPFTWAESYASKIATGENEKNAVIHASVVSALLEKGKSKEFAEAYAKCILENKKDNYANGYALMIEDGKGHVFAKTFAAKMSKSKAKSEKARTKAVEKALKAAQKKANPCCSVPRKDGGKCPGGCTCGCGGKKEPHIPALENSKGKRFSFPRQPKRRSFAKSGQGFDSFSAFKRAMGAAGKGKAWHHIVEQNPANTAKFGNKRIHNTNNLIKLPHGTGTIHAKVSGYYSSKQPFTNGQTVRKWLGTKSYQEQYDFGIETLKKFGWKS